MNYKINQLAQLSGITTRTLRYYDQIGLLKPALLDLNGYRLYTQVEVDLLQHILFYRELGLPLDAIKELIYSPTFNRVEALQHHLDTLMIKQQQLNVLIKNITSTLQSEKEGMNMSNEQKFEGLKKKTLQENEATYGTELRQKYGDETIEKSNAKLKKMGQYDFEQIKILTEQMNTSLKEAFSTSDASCPLAQQACAYHEELLRLTWPEGMYTRESQLALVQSFTEDERFTAYYEKIASGCVHFLLDATLIYCQSVSL